MTNTDTIPAPPDNTMVVVSPEGMTMVVWVAPPAPKSDIPRLAAAFCLPEGLCAEWSDCPEPRPAAPRIVDAPLWIHWGCPVHAPPGHLGRWERQTYAEATIEASLERAKECLATADATVARLRGEIAMRRAQRRSIIAHAIARTGGVPVPEGILEW